MCDQKYTIRDCKHSKQDELPGLKVDTSIISVIYWKPVSK